MPTPSALPSGRLAFVLTDIEGSTRLFRRLGDGYSSVLETHFEVLRACMGAHNGLEVRTIGDALFVVFTDPADALRACVESQVALAADPDLRANNLRVRMGVHVGEGELHGNDYVSLAVHQASRVVAAAHGGQVLATAETVADLGNFEDSVIAAALGEFWLKDFDEPVRLFQVHARGTSPTFPVPRAPSATASNLPRPRTSFVGRQDVLGRLTSLVGASRLVTVVGPGGVGKTRVAVELAGHLAARFSGGVWFADLSVVTDPQALEVSVGTQLGAIRAGVPAFDGISEMLAGEVLLVVDNCEHLVAAAAGLVDMLLSACPALHVLATSREPLRVEDEQLFQLEPLPLPPPQASQEEFEAVASWQLFRRRALRVKDDLELEGESAVQVASICRRLDGIPLALELAAARLSSMSLGQLHDAVERRFDVLVGGLRTAPERQRTLHGMIEWSWSLLSPGEKALAARVSLFRGGFTAETAAQVSPGPGELAETLDALCSRSILSVHGGQQDRYRMLETIREFCELRLRESDDFGRAISAMLDWAIEHAGRAHQAFLGARWLNAMEDIDAEIANLRHAMALGLETRDERAAVVASRITNYWGPRAAIAEGVDWCVRLDDVVDGNLQVAARLRSRHGILLLDHGDVAAAAPLIEGAAPVLLQSDNPAEVSDIRFYLAALRLRQGRTEESIALFEELTAGIDEEDQPVLAAQSYLNRGLARYLLGDLDAGADSLEHALEIARRHQLTRVIAVAVNNLGLLRTQQGRHQDAAVLLAESAAARRVADDMRGLATVLVNLGNLHGLIGDPPAAAGAYLEALEHSIRSDYPWVAAVAVQGICETALAVRRAPDAALLFGAMRRLMRGTDREFEPGRQAELDALRRSIEETLGPAEVARLLQLGEELKDDQVVAEAVEVARAAGADPALPAEPVYR
ncbi:MAG: tetratricopeptide repeat protein [Candidatus Dormibacteraeota bacterium]|nr:tetratricopeptide repeat protein [Candidatus Dormibacteraeota bacterium]